MALIHNILTCSGFAGAGKSSALSLVSMGCIKARLSFILLFFIIALVRKWGGEEFGLEFNFWISILLGMGLYFLIVTFTGNFAWSFVAGLIGALAGGYGVGMIWGGSGGE